jgi:hypothetical protein
MIVSDKKQPKPSFRHKIDSLLKILPRFKFFPIPVVYNLKKLILLVLLVIVVWTFLLSVFIYRQSHTQGFEELALALNIKGRDVKYKTYESTKAVTLAPFRWIKANYFVQGIPRLNIDIKFKHMQKLRAKRERALASDMLVKADDDYVPGKIRLQGEKYKIKLRLKGDWTDHLKGDKWSFRIHVKGKNHLLGMKRFSIQHPRTRNYESEILFFENLRREGVLVPRYFFVEVFINGENIGLMALEEHFSKELLESQNRREGVIVRFDEDKFFLNPKFYDFKTANVKPFRSKKVARSKKLSADLAVARNLLKGFVRGHLKPSQVFDPVLMGKFIAVADIWRAVHALRWHNMRFYFNPITMLLEPIGFDAEYPDIEKRIPPASEEPIISAILDGDSNIKSVYQETVEKLARELEEGTTEKWFHSLAKKQLGILHKEFPFLNGIRFEWVAKRARDVLAISRSNEEMFPEVLQVNSFQEKSINYMEIINPLTYELNVQDIYCVGKNKRKSKLVLDEAIIFPIKLKPTFSRDLPKIYKILFDYPEGKLKCDVVVDVKITDKEIFRTVRAEIATPELRGSLLPAYELQETLALHSFLRYIKNENKLKVLPGDWLVNEWIVVPETLGLEIKQGTTLRFGKTSGLLAKGPVFISGTREEPVVLTSADSSSWPGIAVMKAEKTSEWSYAMIENTSGINRSGWVLPGGVNFYESDIEMDHVEIFENHSEDALNIVRSKFALKHVTIKNVKMDAFDSDFSSGTVEDSMFENIGSQGGGDGIDISGSEVNVVRVFFKNISDKALSVGENSQMKASELNIENVAIGAASKDGSQLLISNSKFYEVKIAGLMAYIKKSEYGPAQIGAEALEFSSTYKQAIAQKGSKIVLDGEEIHTEDLQTKTLYPTTVNP